MKQDVLVSVIVPVYNAEQTVERCVESILGQTLQALEVLAVDDGSTDGSLALLQRMAARDARLTVLSQPNGGVSSARNLAIGQAVGKYLQFVDSDDWIPPDATKRMTDAVERRGCELAIGLYTEVAGNLHLKRGFLREDAEMTQTAFLDCLTAHPNSFYYAALWNKLYLREIVIKHNVRCDERLPWGEDFAFNMRYFRYARRIATLAEPVCFYHRNATGLALNSVKLCVTHPIFSVRVKLWLQKEYDQLFRETGLYEKYRWVLKQYSFKVTISR